jgi:hypothetical protein
LAAMAQHHLPQADHCRAEGAQRGSIVCHSVIAEVTQQDRAQIRSLFRDARVHALPQFVFYRPQLCLPTLPHRLPQYRRPPLSGLPAAMRKAQRVERFRLVAARTCAALCGRRECPPNNLHFTRLIKRKKGPGMLAFLTGRSSPCCYGGSAPTIKQTPSASRSLESARVCTGRPDRSSALWPVGRNTDRHESAGAIPKPVLEITKIETALILEAGITRPSPWKQLGS